MASARTGGGTGRGRSGGSSGIGSAIAAVLAIGVFVAIALGIWALVSDDSAGPEAAVTVSELTGDVDNFLGYPVTVSGEIEELAPAPSGIDTGVAFTLGGGLLVVDANPRTTSLEAGDVVQVSGTVREFDPAVFNRSFEFTEVGGWFETEFFDGWDGEPAIVATFIDPTVPSEDAAG